MTNNTLRKTAEYKHHYAATQSDKLALEYASEHAIDTSINFKTYSVVDKKVLKHIENNYHRAKSEGYYDCDEVDHTTSLRKFRRNNYSA